MCSTFMNINKYNENISLICIRDHRELINYQDYSTEAMVVRKENHHLNRDWTYIIS